MHLIFTRTWKLAELIYTVKKSPGFLLGSRTLIDKEEHGGPPGYSNKPHFNSVCIM